MKYCEEYAALLDRFVDGELTPEEMERARGHLAVCPGCRAYVDDALAIRAGFPDVEDTEVPGGFAEGVMERIRAASEKSGKLIELRRRSARRWAGSLTALAACCALVFLTWGGPGGMNDKIAPTGEENGVPAAHTQVENDTASDCVDTEEPEAVSETEHSEEKQVRATSETEAPRSQFRAQNMDAAPETTISQAPEAVMEDAEPRTSLSAKNVALYLSEEEAGDLLDGFDAVWENSSEWCYELSAEEYQALLEALGRAEELAEGAEGPFWVVVSGPLE